MKKIWLGGRSYVLTDEQFEEMNAYVSDLTSDDPDKPNKVLISRLKSEELALKWIKDEGDIKPKGKSREYIGVVVWLALAMGALVDYFMGEGSGYELAQVLIPALTTGAGINTISPAQTQMESDVLIGDIDTAGPLQGIKVNVDGDTTIDVQNSQPLVSVLFKISQFIAGTVVGLLLKIATGRVICQAGQITFTNGGATTPTVYWNSSRGGVGKSRLIRAKTTTVNPNSNSTFNKGEFAYLAITNPTNVTSIDFCFADSPGIQQNMSIPEVDAFFCKTNETEANGRLDAVVTCIDNTRGNILWVRINVGATAVTVMWVL